MAKIDTTVGELVGMIAHGKLRLPELQRRYVWPATRVRDLLDSLYRGYPSGTILVWESRDAPQQDMAVEQSAHPGVGDQLLLLDGQQRLTSLSAVIRGLPLHVKNRVRPVDIAFNLEHPEGPPAEVLEVEGDEAEPLPAVLDADDVEGADVDENGDGPSVIENIRNRTFVVASRALLSDPHWVRVSEVFDERKSDWDLLKPLGIMPDDPRWDRYTKRLQRVRAIRSYPYVMHALESDLSYEEVAEIFVRVNSLGMKLRGSDLALAQITARWPNSLHRFEELQAECEQSWFNIDLGVLVRALVVFSTGQCRFHSVGRLAVPTLERAWRQVQNGLRFAIAFLRQDAGIDSDIVLSSPYFLIVVAVCAVLRDRHLTESERRDLLHWVFAANAMAHYSGSSETRLDADLAILNRGGGASDLLEVVQQGSGRVRFTARDFEHRSIRHPLFTTAFLALRHAGARDWGTGLRIALSREGRWRWIEGHHLFPKSVVTQAGYEKAEVNDIANLVFLTGASNRRVGRQKPEEYLRALLDADGEQALRAHAIPPSPELWRVDNYRAFLQARRRLLADAVNAFLDEVASGGRPAVDAAALIEAGESDTVEFKAALRWNPKSGQPEKFLEQKVIKTIAGFLNARGGTLFIGVDDHGETVGLDGDITTLGKPNVDGFELHLRNVLSGAIGPTACAQLEVRFPLVDDRTVCMVRVPPTQEPVFVRDGSDQTFYARVGNRTEPLAMAEAHRYIDQRFR